MSGETSDPKNTVSVLPREEDGSSYVEPDGGAYVFGKRSQARRYPSETAALADAPPTIWFGRFVAEPVRAR